MNTGKKFIGVMLAVLMLALVAGCTTETNTTIETSDENDEFSTEGRVVMTVTDAATDMGTVTSIDVTIDSVQVHSAAEGWVTVATPGETYDLLELKASGNQALLADVKLEEGTYDQIRLDVSEVIVTDANGTHEAKMPSDTLSFKGEIVVEANKTSSATFDFIADESLHMTGNGEYVMAPVIQFDSKTNAQVDVSSETDVVIMGGKSQSSTRVGMDISGELKVGGKLPSVVKIGSNGKVSGVDTAVVASNSSVVGGIVADI